MFKALIPITIAVLHLVSGGEANPSTESSFTDLDVQFAVENLRTFTTAGSTYAASLFKANWFAANLACTLKNLTLASIGSFEEGEQIRSHLISEGFLRFGNEIFWLSGADLSASRNFFWFGTGRRIVFRNWSIGEPKRISPGCVAMRHDGRWINSDCSTEYYYICQERA